MLTFVPFPFIHPLRVRRLRAFNLAVLALGGVLAIVALLHDMAPDGWVTGGLCAIGLDVVAAGLLRTSERAAAPPS